MNSLRLFLLTMLLSVAIVSSPVLHCSCAFGQIRTDEDTSNEEEPTNQEDPNTNGGVIGNQAGVSINALDVLRSLSTSDSTNELDTLRRSSGKSKARNRTLRKPAVRMRYVSLPRLERAVAKRTTEGEPLTAEMKYLAGLFRADCLYIYPEHDDVVIAGPAGNWHQTRSGNVLSAGSRAPVLRLEDLIVALRAFPGNGAGVSEIGCSIDPTSQGLARMQAYVKSIARRPPSAQVIAAGLKKSLGKQKVTVHGIPASTHFARVMVEADYRMKLIGIGLETPAVAIKSYLSLARPRSPSNGMARWYFTPQYECIRMDRDRQVLQLVSTGARLSGEAELVSANGERSQSARRDRASVGFTTDFTRKYAALAKAEPIYAELRNVMDLSIIGAALRFLDAYERCDWQPDVFLNASKLDVENHDVPTKLPTAVNVVWKGRRLLTPVGGGVSIRSSEVFESMQTIADTTQPARPEFPSNLADDQWWWDQ